MHDCIVKLLKNHDLESLECLCRLLSTIGKDLDFEKAKPRMDQYFHQMEKIIKERKTSSRIRFMLQDVLDLRRNNWVPRRGDQGPKTIEQIHKEAELEEHREQVKVQQQLLSKKGSAGGGGGGVGPRGGPHTPGSRGNQAPDDGWNMVPISTKNRPIDPTRLSKITKPGALDFSSQLLAPGGKGSWGSWGKGSSGGSGAKPSDSSECHYLFLFLCHADGTKHTLMIFLTGFVVCVCNFSAVKRETVPTPPPASSKPALTEDELDKKSTAIIEEYLHINDMKVHTLTHSHTHSLTHSLKPRSHRQRLFLITLALMPAGSLPLLEVLEVAEDMAIDIPHIWLYLAELISPMLHEGGIPMGPLFREVSKPLVPLGKAGVLLVEILKLLCKAMSHKKVGAMWRDAALSWKDFLPEDEDANKFVTEEGVEFTLGEECVRKSSKVSPEDISRELERLLQEKADNQRIFDWVEANLDEQQTSSNMFVRPLMTAVCQSAIICENPYKVDTKEMTQRAKLLQRYIKDEQKELQALYALQSLMMQMEQPPNLLRMFFDVLYDEDVIKEDGFYRWESSKDPVEQQGKGVALKSVTAFFTWLREAEDESDNS
uniref:W2 domain-containing protein n=1 Tax=Sinocyclocheilus rhinocerous TaxID=307959 RepID=A0A673NLZ8_9TELE